MAIATDRNGIVRVVVLPKDMVRRQGPALHRNQSRYFGKPAIDALRMLVSKFCQAPNIPSRRTNWEFVFYGAPITAAYI